MKIVVLGSTGMLGSAVGKHMIKMFGKDNVYLSYRNSEMKFGLNTFFFDPTKCGFDVIPRCDYIINCIGITKPFIEEDVVNSIQVNAVFPWILARYFKGVSRLMHITTDCVFSGKEGRYTESFPHNCLDIYGKTKSLGEPVDKCMVLRTSIIGEEIHKKKNLVEWLKSLKDVHEHPISGYINHFWNGITTLQYAEICESIIKENRYSIGLFHIFSPDIVSKYQLLCLLNQRLGLDIKIEPVWDLTMIDRTLSTDKNLNQSLKIPFIKEQIEKM